MSSRGRHIAGHQLADLHAGRLDSARARAIRSHLDGCETCQRALERVAAAHTAMASIANEPAPDIKWDGIAARLHWERSTAERARTRDPRPLHRPVVRYGAGVVAVGMAAVAGLWLWPSSDAGEPDEPARHAMIDAELRTVAAPVETAPPAPLAGLVTFASGQTSVGQGHVGPAELVNRPIAAGDRIATDGGRLVVQFGEDSGIALGSGTIATFERFDDRAIVIAVDGEIEVELAKRKPGQRFEIVAGRHRVAVRGTGFRVDHRDGALEVRCAHGSVVVTDGVVERPIEAGFAIDVLSGALLDRSAAYAMAPRDLAELEDGLAGPLLPAWTHSDALLATSAVLEIEADIGRPVRIDGVEVGNGPFAIRLMSGRHEVRASDGHGRFGEPAWIELAAAGTRSAVATPTGRIAWGDRGSVSDGSDARSALSSRAARRTRRAQLAQAVEDSRQIDRCMAPLAKRDLVAGSFIVFDIGVNDDGSQGHLNVAESNLPAAIERCLRRVVDSAALPPGPAAVLRYKLDFD